MVSDIFYFLLLFLIFGCSESQDCAGLLYKTSVNKGCYSSFDSCISEKEENRSACVFTPTVTYNIDTVYGIANASFALPPLNCCYTSYMVELYVDEKNESNSLCSEDLKDYTKHSVKDYNIWKCKGENCVDDKCDQYGKVVFRYVFSGCYKLQITPYIHTSTQASLNSKAAYIESNYTKEKVEDQLPYVGPTYRAKEHQYDVNIYTNSEFESMVITFVGDLKELIDETCDQDGVDQSCCVVHDSRSSTCRKIRNITEPTCVMSQEVHCTFYNVTPGNYCIRISIEDDRCLSGTMWTSTSNPCRWSRTLEIKPQSPDKPFVAVFSPPSIVISIIIILTGLLFLAVLSYWLFQRRKSSWISRPGESPEEVIRPMIHKMKVLLLYPRDCKDFMNVMESFRKILENFHNVEVFDCYKNEEVLNGPLAWLQSLMGQPRLCTIIVTSHCAYLQQKALKSGHTTNSYSIYKEPTFLDTLFIFGLKLIMEDISSDIYHKNYVIGFNGFSENSNILSLPTSYRRYIIPDHLGKLLSDMNVDNTDENFLVQHSSEYIALQNNIRSLVDYKSKNPHYLENLLNLM